MCAVPPDLATNRARNLCDDLKYPVRLPRYYRGHTHTRCRSRSIAENINMSKIRYTGVVVITLLASALSGCSGSGASGASTSAPPNGGTPEEPAIEGIAMPSNVSVVTATNAQ
jgi:hypothetical protein